MLFLIVGDNINVGFSVFALIKFALNQFIRRFPDDKFQFRFVKIDRPRHRWQQAECNHECKRNQPICRFLHVCALPLLDRQNKLLGNPALQAVRDRRTAREILEAVEALRQAETWCNANVGTGAICGALAVKL